MGTYTPSPNARRMAQQYLKHEFRKVFHDIRDVRTWRRLDRSITTYVQRENDDAFWNLVSAISENLKLKRVYHVLSSTKFRWKLETIPLNSVLLGGMSPRINRYTIKKFKRNPIAFALAWKSDTAMRRTILKTGLLPHPERDHFPIFTYQTPQGYVIFDGMRCTLVSLTRGKRTIRAWVGYETNHRGKSLVSGGRAYFIENLYSQAAQHDAELDRALIRIGSEIMRTYRNGREVLIKRIADWTYDPGLKRLINKMKS